MGLKKSYYTYIVVILIALGAVLRVYNLNWGAPFYFHPDERNIASAVSQLVFPRQMNPHFFAYGSFPVYTIFFTGLIKNFFTSCHFVLTTCTVSFEQAILISRMYSWIFSLFTLPLLFTIGKKLYGDDGGVIATTLATVSVGLIQFAHFGTTESWLTLLGTLLFALLLSYNPSSKRTLIALGLVCGMLVAVKVSSLVLFIIPLPVFIAAQFTSHHNVTFARRMLKGILNYVGMLWIAGLFYLITNPYVLLDTTAFLGSMRYESTLAIGTLPVFYTQEFNQTTPILYQLRFIFPFLINPVLTVLFPFAFLLVLYRSLTKKNLQELMLVIFFAILFLSQAFLFAKWTRYMVPTLPFLYLILAGGIKYLGDKRGIFMVGLSVLSGICAFAYVITAFVQPDTRIQAAEYARTHLPESSQYLSEVYDLGIMPFNSVFPNITLFNFYDLDTPTPEANPERLAALLTQTNYVILPSQRLYKTRLVQKERYQEGNRFYSSLENTESFRKVYETPCDLFCRLTYLGNPVFSYEGTASVFDRPTVMIYQKL